MVFDPVGKEKFRMHNSEIIYRYLHGGCGVVILANPTTWKAHAYQFSHPKDVSKFPEGQIFVYALHEKHSYYIGMLNDKGMFKLTNASRFNPDTEVVKGASYIAKMSLNQKLVDANQMYLYHAGTCCRCGKKLHGRFGLSQGIGRRCYSKYISKISSDTGPWNGNS